MSENDKSLRLLKVAKELNIGTATITEYLAGKGFQVENKPTAKITDDMYGVLLKEFQGDKIIKEEAKQIAIGKIRRDELHAGNSGDQRADLKSPRPSFNHEDEGDEILIKNAGSNQQRNHEIALNDASSGQPGNGSGGGSSNLASGTNGTPVVQADAKTQAESETHIENKAGQDKNQLHSISLESNKLKDSPADLTVGAGDELSPSSAKKDVTSEGTQVSNLSSEDQQNGKKADLSDPSLKSNTEIANPLAHSLQPAGDTKNPKAQGSDEVAPNSENKSSRNSDQAIGNTLVHNTIESDIKDKGSITSSSKTNNSDSENQNGESYISLPDQSPISEVSAKANINEKGDDYKEGKSNVETESVADSTPQLKIVGKINLDNINPRGRNSSSGRTTSNQRKPENPGTGATAKGNSLNSASLPRTANAQAVVSANNHSVPSNSAKTGENGPKSNSPGKSAKPNETGKQIQGNAAPLNTISPQKGTDQDQNSGANSAEDLTSVSSNSAETGILQDNESNLPKSDEDKLGEKEKLNTNFQKLSGPSIIGKIELPQSRKSQPVASSGSPIEQAKRKRKRKDAFPGSGGSNSGAGSHGSGGSHNSSGSGQTTGNIAPSNDPRRSENRPGGPVGQRAPFKKDDRPRTPHAEPTEKEIQDQIKATLARLSGAGKSGKFAQRAKFRRQKRDDNASTREEDLLDKEAQSKILKVTEFVTANELSKLMDVPVNQVISTCMSLGMFVSINQRLDAETLTIVAEEFGYKVDFVSAESEVLTEEEIDAPEDLLPRAPIVTVMGHVDHGKTSLLDYIRNANVIGGEAGGITQHIGAYEVKLENGKTITFLDTPGHEAFTAMRARGAQSTDIVIIVIAADDAVMPQTIEAINHAQAAGVPMVFAFNKMDKPGANPEKIRDQLSQMNILVEEWGGKFQTQEISAKKGENVELLLEKVLLEAELLDLKANPNKRAVGTVVEAALDKGRGIVTTILVQSGTLRVGDPILAGCYSGRVKAMFNERQQKVQEAGPSAPVLVLGMQGAPQAGDKFLSMESEPEAREIANKRLQLQREQGIRTQKHITLDEIGRRLAIGNFKELNIIVKGDVDGSIEALSDSLLKLSSQEIQVNVLHKSVGQISESDVLLASASDAIIIGFQVRPSASARKLAEQEQIDIRLYSIIYDAIGEIKSAMEGMLSPVFEEKIVCNVEIRNVFKISKVGTIAGCYVLDGKINRNTSVRIIRDGVVVHSGSLDSLKRFKDDVKEVAAGYECGLNIHNFNNIEEGDIIEGYEQVEVKRKLV